MDNKIQPKIICVDFDDTCVKQPIDSKYPDVGPTIEIAPLIIKELIRNGHKIVLWTVRDMGQDGILKAIQWYQDNGIQLYGINGRPEHDTTTEEAIRMRASTSPKVRANSYVDDAAIGCPLIYEEGFRPYVDWQAVRAIFVQKGYL
jgi:hypothetical protein